MHSTGTCDSYMAETHAGVPVIQARIDGRDPFAFAKQYGYIVWKKYVPSPPSLFSLSSYL